MTMQPTSSEILTQMGQPGPQIARPGLPRRAHVFVIGNEKGGSGKSTTAMHLIVALLREGFSVASIDLDARQATLTRYFENRKDMSARQGVDVPMPEHFAVSVDALSQLGDQQEQAARLSGLIEDLVADHDYLVIDTPGTDSLLSRVGHSFADTLITPMNDSFIDLDLLARVDGESLVIKGPSVYAEMVWEQRRQRNIRDGGQIDWIVMRNRMSSLDPRNKRDIERILGELSKRVGFRVAPGFSERVIFRELFLQGLTLLDLRDVRSRFTVSHVAARQEIRALLKEIDYQAKRPILAEAS